MRAVDGRRLLRVTVTAYVAVPAGASRGEARRAAITALGEEWEEVGPTCDVVEATERRVHVDGVQAHPIVGGFELVRDFTDAAAAIDRRPVPGWLDVERHVAQRLGLESPAGPHVTAEARLAAARLVAVRVACARAGARVELEQRSRSTGRLLAVVGDVDRVDRLRVGLRRSIGLGEFRVVVDRPSTAEIVRRLDVAAGAADPGAVLVASRSMYDALPSEAAEEASP